MNKRVLIITYYWPPSGGSGVQRWLKFSKYLPEAGWEPIIFTPENPDFDLQDITLEKEISKELEVIKFPIWEPYQLLDMVRGKKDIHAGRILEKRKTTLLDRAAIWLRANLLVPDPRIFWVKPAVKFLTELIEKGQFQAIITTGPPHSMHLIGDALKKKTGVFWLADFRDPWSQWEFLDKLPMQKIVRKKHADLERSVLGNADVITTISPTFQQDLEQLANRSVDLLTNGYDSSDLPPSFVKKNKSSNELHLVYSGIIDSIRNPMPLIKAMREEFLSEKANVRFTFVGRVSDHVQAEISADNWMSTHVKFAGYVSHQEVFDFYKKADVLVLILTNTKNAKGNIPGKLFEYLSTGIQILALGDPKGDCAKIIEDVNAGQVWTASDYVKIQIHLRKLFEEEGSIQALASIDQYSRKNLSFQLAKLLDGNSIS
jgi:glycosyltransferase involved in cell wall biosynthesis